MKLAASVLVAICCAVAAAQPVLATFLDSDASAAQVISSGVLMAPTTPVAGLGTCTPADTDRIVVTWTATSSQKAAGYEILRSTTAGGPYNVAGTVSGVETTTFTDSSLAWSTTYHYRVRATKHLWRSASTDEVQQTTRTQICV